MTNTTPTLTRGKRHAWTRGDRLRAAREDMPNHPTQAEFATILGFSRNTVARYERDEPGTNKYIVIKLWADVTGYDIEWLLGEEGSLPDIGPSIIGYPLLPVESLRFAA